MTSVASKWPADKSGACARIVAIVAEEFGVPVEDMLSESQRREFVRARMAAMVIARRTTDLSEAAVGRAFQRERTSVRHATATVKTLWLRDEVFRSRLVRCEERVRAATAAQEALHDIATHVGRELQRLVKRALERDATGAAVAVRDALRAFLDNDDIEAA